MSHESVKAFYDVLLIMLSMVTMLNSVPLPLTKAFCNSAGVIVPDLFASTLCKLIFRNAYESDFLPFKVALQLVLSGHVWRGWGRPARLELGHPDQMFTSLLSKGWGYEEFCQLS